MWMQYILRSINIQRTRIPIKGTRTSWARLGQQLKWQSGSWLQCVWQSPGTKQIESRIQSKISRPIQATAKHGGSYRPNKRRCWWLLKEMLRNRHPKHHQTAITHRQNQQNGSTHDNSRRHDGQTRAEDKMSFMYVYLSLIDSNKIMLYHAI